MFRFYPFKQLDIVLISAAHIQTFDIKLSHTQNTHDLIKIIVLKYTISSRENFSFKIGLVLSFSNKQQGIQKSPTLTK